METIEEYREIEFEGTKLRVYKNGDIFRQLNAGGPYGKKGDWILTTCMDTNGYLRFKINNKQYLNHRIVGMCYLGLDINKTKHLIDHIDRCRTNNNINNLRIVNNQQNQWNNNEKGYSFYKRRNKWRARISVNNKSIYLGLFDTEQEASDAYQNAKKLYHVI